MHSAAKHIKFSMDEIISAHFSDIRYLFVFAFISGFWNIQTDPALILTTEIGNSSLVCIFERKIQEFYLFNWFTAHSTAHNIASFIVIMFYLTNCIIQQISWNTLLWRQSLLNIQVPVIAHVPHKYFVIQTSWIKECLLIWLGEIHDAYIRDIHSHTKKKSNLKSKQVFPRWHLIHSKTWKKKSKMHLHASYQWNSKKWKHIP